MESERRGETLIFRTGPGEWFNRPDRGRWDMGEDAMPQRAAWHAALHAAVMESAPAAHAVVVDAREVWDLVGADWGALVKLQKLLRARGAGLVLVGNARALRAAAVLGLDPILRTRASVEAALDVLRGDEPGTE